VIDPDSDAPSTCLVDEFDGWVRVVRPVT